MQLEALLMSLLSGHPNIVQTYKCLASWRDLAGQSAGQVQVRKKGHANKGACEVM